MTVQAESAPDPDSWVEHMMTLKLEGARGVKVTLKEVIDRAENPEINATDLRPTR